MHLELRGTLLAALSGILYGMLGYLGTQLFDDHFSVVNMLFWRFFIAAIWIGICMFIMRKKIFQSENDHRALIKIFTFGAICYSGSSACYFLASRHIGTGLAMVVFFSFPVFVTLFSWLFSSWKFNKYTFISLFAVMTGLLCLEGHGNNTLDFLGLLFSIISAIFYAIYIYGSRSSAQLSNAWLLTFLICSGNALIFFALAIYTHTFMLPVEATSWLYVLALGIIATAVPIQLLLNGLKYISPVKASILSVFEPLVTVLMGFMLLGETMSTQQTLGVIIVLLGAIFIQFERRESSSAGEKLQINQR